MRRGVGRLAAALTLWLALPAAAQDNFPVAETFADQLTARSSWADIMRTPGVRVEFPMLNFGAAYVSLSAVCAEGGLLRIADPGADRGIRLGREAAIRYQASVYKVSSWAFTMVRPLLFQKPWDVPACPGS